MKRPIVSINKINGKIDSLVLYHCVLILSKKVTNRTTCWEKKFPVYFVKVRLENDKNFMEIYHAL